MTTVLDEGTLTLTGGVDELGPFTGVVAVAVVLDLTDMVASDEIVVRLVTDTPTGTDVVVDELTIEHGVTTHPYAWPGAFGSATEAFIHPRVLPISTTGKVTIEQTAGSSFDVGYQIFEP